MILMTIQQNSIKINKINYFIALNNDIIVFTLYNLQYSDQKGIDSMYKIGLDVGSTTLKCIVFDENSDIIYQKYERHLSLIAQKSAEMLSEAATILPTDTKAALCVTGSAGMGFAEAMGIPFVQEVYATRIAVKSLLPETDVVIELGGEDAKILFVSGAPEVRMNGSCAGGTGAFIDQMATLLDVTPSQMDELAKDSDKIYSIASRCGVFAKSDIQPLLNQGARREDISASIFAAVVNQTVAGLAQGREIKGNVIYLGGPLTFFSQLRFAFDRELKKEGLCPENSLYFVATGAAMYAKEEFDLNLLSKRIADYKGGGEFRSCPVLFGDKSEYEAFIEDHKDKTDLTGKELCADNLAYIGIDAGSTTVKTVVVNSRDEVVYSKYLKNSGNPVPLVRDILLDIYKTFPNAIIASSACTGYGEEIIKHAFHIDHGIVETIAHFTAAKKYDPEVDYIIDIGGQDIKCFRIRDGAIDDIFLNEACSSGCGSFLQTFAGALGYDIAEFAKLGIEADMPVDLGSRCTVFMNSSVKQAQKDGASIANISAGLSISVVKNALYKVIRVSGSNKLGKHIVVQGGTFLNDAVLRAFEQEIGYKVTRPSLAGVMGAYGAALWAKEAASTSLSGSIITNDALESFKHEVRAITCKGCTNSCKLTINTFDDGSRFIGGNQCDKPITGNAASNIHNLYDYKRKLLSRYSDTEGSRATIGLPMGLNFYELLPFWHKFFTELGFGIKISPASSRKLYRKGQATIPSDTVCYPAKLIHGHVEALCDDGVDAVFYPCMSYNFDEGLGDNHYNCPVVAYYPEVIGGNMKSLEKTKFIKDYFGLHRKKDFPKKIHAVLCREFGDIPLADVKKAAKAAYTEYDSYMNDIRKKGEEYLKYAQANDLPVIILCGRPYHLDPEISHGIDKYICQCGAVLVTEDSLGNKYKRFPTTVLNQWSYHSRMYAAARFVAESDNPDLNLVQLVSFGCGVDAITTDEMRKILSEGKRIYTQLKIDEITNLGAVKIRLRSLFAAIEQKKKGGRV